MSATIGYLLGANYDTKTGKFLSMGNTSNLDRKFGVDRYVNRQIRKQERRMAKVEKRYNQKMRALAIMAKTLEC